VFCCFVFWPFIFRRYRVEEYNTLLVFLVLFRSLSCRMRRVSPLLTISCYILANSFLLSLFLRAICALSLSIFLFSPSHGIQHTTIHPNLPGSSLVLVSLHRITFAYGISGSQHFALRPVTPLSSFSFFPSLFFPVFATGRRTETLSLWTATTIASLPGYLSPPIRWSVTYLVLWFSFAWSPPPKRSLLVDVWSFVNFESWQ
jgi:hypothetical protein